MSETRYDWPVDRRPTQVRYTVLGDITGSIKISMEFKPTFTTEKGRTVTITFVNMATNRTLLRSVPGINRDNQFTQSLGFVSDKLFQFKEGPVIEFPVEFGSTSFLDTDFGEVFESEYRKWGLNDLLRDTMINISHKPSFSTGEFTEFPFSGSSAFGLQLSSEISVLRPLILHSSGIKESVVGTDCNVDDPPVDPEYGLFRNLFRSIRFKLTMQVKRTVVLTKQQRRRFDFPCQVRPVIFRNTECGFNPSIRSGDSGISRSQKHIDNPGIVSHCRILFTERFELTFHRFQAFTSNISCTLYQRGREIRNRLSNIVIGRIMAVNLAGRFGVKTPCRADVKCRSVISHGFKERNTCIGRNIQFQLDCPNHNHILTSIGNILNGGDADTLIPDLKFGVSALHL